MQIIMKNKSLLLILTITILFFTSCSNTEKDYDASGSFEAIERTISAEATGKISALHIEEGQLLKAGDTIGSIDISNLVIQSEQIKASIDAIGKKTNNPAPQVNILSAQLKSQKSQTASIQQQLTNLNKEIKRFQKLVNANAVPQKQLDDMHSQQLVLQKQLEASTASFDVIKSQIKAAKQNVGIQNRAILSEVGPNQKRLELLAKQINDGTIINQFNGTITTQMAYDGEFTIIGKPLYKIADLSTISLRAYVSGNQLPNIKLNQEVNVQTDNGQGGFKTTNGQITWISSKAEFTPKTIQTKDERANLVYAIKVKVINDGSYKIGMYGEIKF